MVLHTSRLDAKVPVKPFNSFRQAEAVELYMSTSSLFLLPNIWLWWHLNVYCVISNVAERTIAGFLIKCGTDPLLALAAWPVKLPWISSRAKTDAALALAPPTTDFAIRRPAAAQRWFRGQSTHTTHLAGKKEEGQLQSSIRSVWREGSSVPPPVSVWTTVERKGPQCKQFHYGEINK